MAGGPARNRVTPLGDIVAVPGRGSWMGNRGRLHEGRGTRDIVRSYRGKMWIICTLSFKDRQLPQWEPGHNTQLFFLDEAVALAAGHRPCAECRRASYNAYRAAWGDANHGVVPYAKDMDEQLHRERRPVAGQDRKLHTMDWHDVPDGVFVAAGPGPGVVAGDHISVWDARGHHYGEKLPRPQAGPVGVITPWSSVEVLRRGYPVQVDAAARQPRQCGDASTPGPGRG